MKNAYLLIVLLGTLCLKAGELKPGTEWAELKTADGKVFKSVKVMKVSPVELRIMHADGLATLPLSALPADLLALYGGSVDRQAEQMAANQRKLENARAYAEGQEVKQQLEAKTIQAQRESAAAEAAAVAAASSQPMNALASSSSIASRPVRSVGRSTSDPDRMGEMAGRQARSEQGTKVETLAQAIQLAIQNRRMVVIQYDNGLGGSRLVEPCAVGLTMAGNWAMEGRFVEGVSVSGDGPGIRTYLLEKITDFQMSDKTF